MLRNRPRKQQKREREETSKALLRKIGVLDPYADSPPQDVEQRLRNMTYGATNSRVTKLRRGEAPVTG